MSSILGCKGTHKYARVSALGTKNRMTPFSAVKVATSTSSSFSFFSVYEGKTSPMSIALRAGAAETKIISIQAKCLSGCAHPHLPPCPHHQSPPHPPRTSRPCSASSNSVSTTVWSQPQDDRGNDLSMTYSPSSRPAHSRCPQHRPRRRYVSLSWEQPSCLFPSQVPSVEQKFVWTSWWVQRLLRTPSREVA